MCIKNRAIHYEAESCPQACTCLRLHMCICAPKEPYRSSPGIVTGAVLSHISPRCLFVQQHLRASPPLTAARLSPETDAYPAQTEQTESKRSNKTADFFLFLTETQILLGRRSPPVCGRSESICIYARTHISRNKNLWKIKFIQFAFDVEQRLK